MAMKAGGDGDLNADINVTPLVDVMLVLLIIFMITTGVQNGAVQLDLPQVNAQAPDDPDAALILSIKPGNKVELAGTPIKWVDLEAKLKTNTRIQDQKKLYVDAFRSVPYEVVLTAMQYAKDAGVEHVMMLTNPGDAVKPELLDANKIP